VTTSVLAGTINGDLKISGATGDITSNPDGFPSMGYDDTMGEIHIHGDVKYAGNRGIVYARGAEIGGDLKINGNKNGVTLAGPVVKLNVVSGDLKCAGNSPAPSVEGNTVDGKIKGQCAESEGI
jgi:hypothetical protein